ncbi:MAG: 16S rRNA (guanine(966)-N(2))-methyltransferase RsmD [Hydrogenophilales bacterium 28-61-23]|nr:MAG: 16S rRNA (guanine(966)-N(2))-methyltransferase RsmD [Hydrogenophilales bacterium 28-61-23]
MPSRSKRENSVRIIGGEYRSRILHFPDAPGLRPTPDRVRETVFNWLGQRLHGLVCLDAFAGSGALGFEAASRGAERVVMLERDGKARDALRQNASLLQAGKVDILQMDALAYLSRPGELFDVIFLDPPFGMDLLTPAIQHAATRLRPGGKIYAESPAPLRDVGFSILRQGRAGLSHFCLLEPV